MHCYRLRSRLTRFTFVFVLLLLSTASMAKTELVMVTHWNTEITQGALLNEYIAEYNKLQDDVEIILRNDPGASDPAKVLLWATTGTMPDILPVSQVNIPQFVAEGIISPFADDDVVRMRDTYLPGALQLVTYDDRLWGYPTENMPNAFTYDMIDFDNKGIGDQFPDTWPDLLAVAKHLTEYDAQGNIVRAGIGWNLDFRRNLGLLYALTWANGGDVFINGDKEINLLSPTTISAIEFMIDITQNSSVALFGGNHSHSVQAIRWAPGPYIQSAILAESGEDRLDDIKSARLPVGENGQRTVANYGWIVAVPTATEHKEAVHTFLQWMTMELTERGTTRMGDVLALLGSIPNTMDDMQNQPMAQHRFLDGFIAPMYDGDVRSWPMPPNSNAVFGEMNRTLTDILTGSTAPVNALENLQKQVTQLINDVSTTP